MLVLFNLGCGITTPKPDFCGIYSPSRAECNPTDPSKRIYELELIDMLGYQCVSPEDFAKIKSYLKKIGRELDKGTNIFSSQVKRWP